MMSGDKKERRGNPLLSFFIIFALLSIFFADIILSNRTLSTSAFLPGTTPDGPYLINKEKITIPPPFTFDLSGNGWINEPNPYIIKKEISEGLSPVWNTGEGFGMPLLANPNTEVLNPLKLFLHLHPTPFLHDMFFLLRLLFMGIFTCLFLKKLRLSNLSSLFGATFFMLSGYSIWWINLHPLSSEMYISGLFYFYETYMSHRDTKDNENNPPSPPFSKGGKGGFSGFFFCLFLAFSIFGGKPHVITMGLILLFLYAVYRGIAPGKVRQILTGIVPLRLIILIVSGMLIASVLILPFTELLKESSLIARSVRTGASSHTLPLISSVTLWQPLFLGLKNYFYGSWLKWSPFYMVPYAGITVLLLYIYGALSRMILLKVFPFYLFSLFLFLKIYGLLPNDLFIGVPLLGSTNFIKYHGMLFFSLAVISAHTVEDIKMEKPRLFYLAIFCTSAILVIYFYALYGQAPPEKIGFITKILMVNLSVFFILGLLFYILKKYGAISIFPLLLFLLMLAELYTYLPKEHPERAYPYTPPPYLELFKEDHPFRVIGDGSSVPPLISSAMGLHDLRGINVLIPNDYYLFFQNLISFSVPYTNNPSPIVVATSPFTDLSGAKYILSRNRLDIGELQQALRHHLDGLRTIRYLNSIKSHSIRGGGGYGYFEKDGENRFSFLFPQNFNFTAEVEITEPYLFIGLAMDPKTEKGSVVRVNTGDRIYTISVDSERWRDRWIDVSEFIGKTIDIVIDGVSSGGGGIALGAFGFSKGEEWERRLLNSIYPRHLKEFDYIKYIGQYEGIHTYENENVMPRAFIVHLIKPVDSLNDVISELQNGLDFRRIALVEGKDWNDALFQIATPLIKSGARNDSIGDFSDETVTIRRYSFSRVEIDVNAKGGLLVLSDLYYPGWKVKVNGKEDEIIRTFGSLRGVVVPEGRSEVVFYYRPLSLYIGAVISLISLTVWIVLLFSKMGNPQRS